MRGRTQAVIAAVLTTGTVLFAWLGAAVVALVTLRKGSTQGSAVLAWAMLPALGLAAIGDTGPLTTVLGVMLAATALRLTTSWPYALAAAVASGLITAGLMATVGSAYVEQIATLFQEALQQMAAQQGTEVPMPEALQIAGLLGLSNTLMVILCLLLARWWQAMLYNPGGFRDEFHALRLRPPMTIGLLVVGLALSSLGQAYTFWALIPALPLLFAGLGLVHGLIAKKGLGTQWLVGFYLLWFLLGPVKGLLFVLAVIDSWLDFRSRISGTPGSA